MKNKNAQTITQELSNILTKSKQKRIKIGSDREAEFYSSVSQNFPKVKKIQHESRFINKGPSVAETVIRTMRKLLRKPVFEKGNANLVCELPSVINKNRNKIHHSIKMTSNNASKTAIEN